MADDAFGGARRFWTYGKGSWSGPLISLGGDEYGNRPLVFRLPGQRAFLACWNFPLRRHRLISGMTLDVEANIALIEFIPPPASGRAPRVEESLRVGCSILANYNAAGDVVSLELLRIDALSDPAEVAALRGILPRYVVDDTVQEAEEFLARRRRCGKVAAWLQSSNEADDVDPE